MRTPQGIVLLCSVLLVGCGHDFEPPDRAARVEEAAAVYSPTIFDSVTWANDSLRTSDGNGVYAAKCGRCHGSLGSGKTEYAKERGLDVPTLVSPDWPLASMDSLRRTIFVGHEEGMPGYGIAGITPREIDASAFYVLFQLRPDVLGTGGGPGDAQ